VLILTRKSAPCFGSVRSVTVSTRPMCVTEQRIGSAAAHSGVAA
jgi:hypothetical protein